MRRSVIFLLLGLMLFDTVMYQVEKTPLLFEHFSEHKSLNQSISFLNFLAMHYWGDDQNDKDDAKDMQLPFKKFEGPLHHCVFIPSTKSFVLHASFQEIPVNYGVDKPRDHFSPALDKLFRPPQV